MIKEGPADELFAVLRILVWLDPSAGDRVARRQRVFERMAAQQHSSFARERLVRENYEERTR